MSDPITREETYLSAIAGDDVNLPDPITRKETYLAAMAGMAVELPAPVTREEAFLKQIVDNGGPSGEGVTIRNQNKTITENGEYTADSGYTGLGVVTVNVEASGGGDDELIAVLNKSIVEIDNPNVDKIGIYSFYGCLELTRVNLVNVIDVGSSAFTLCSALETVNLPNAVANGAPASVWNGCTSLRNVNIPKWGRVSRFVFGGCTALKFIDLPMSNQIDAQACSNSSNLSIICLRRSENVKLMNVNAFEGTPFASGGTGGVLLIPFAQVEAYKIATNWSALYGYGTNRFLALEDYTVDGTITGEIDWDKVNALFEEASE